MNDPVASSEVHARFNLFLFVVALGQGLLLYGLHEATKHDTWPATQPALLHALYAVAIWIPITIQLLARHVRSTVMWKAVLLMTVVLALVGWHVGSSILGTTDQREREGNPEIYIGSGIALMVLWLVVVAFLRARLETALWKPPYEALFAAAWRNKLTLAEAALFVGLLWILLATCAALFHTLQIDFFRDLFRRPVFYYPVTALAIGSALQLIGGIDRLVDVVLRQLLGLLKWLAPVAGLIVVLFTLALLPKLPGLIHNGVRALSAAWLLWLVAWTVLLINAAYQDGRQAPYGKTLAMGMRVVPPLLVIVASTALYALLVRVQSYGLTAGRYWALVTASMALLHAGCYAWTAFRGSPWMMGISRTNPWMAMVLSAVLLLSLTPVLSPQRLSAASQERVLKASSSDEQRRSALVYLRFNAGEYGERRVRELTRGTDTKLAALASQVLRASDPYSFELQKAQSPEQWLEKIALYPTDHPLPPALRAQLLALEHEGDLAKRSVEWRALWVNLAGDEKPELLLMQEWYTYWMFAESPEGWQRISSGVLEANDRSALEPIAVLQAGDIGTAPAEYPDLLIGKSRLHLQPADRK
jgi:hypothetical protein